MPREKNCHTRLAVRRSRADYLTYHPRLDPILWLRRACEHGLVSDAPMVAECLRGRLARDRIQEASHGLPVPPEEDTDTIAVVVIVHRRSAHHLASISIAQHIPRGQRVARRNEV